MKMCSKPHPIAIEPNVSIYDDGFNLDLDSFENSQDWRKLP